MQVCDLPVLQIVQVRNSNTVGKCNEICILSNLDMPSLISHASVFKGC